MALDMSNIQGVGQEFLDKIISGGLIVMGVIFLIVVILGIGLYIRWLRQFNVRVEIKSLRGSGTMGEPIYKIVNDVGGFVENKTDKTRWFRLRNQKVDLPSPPLEALELDSTGRNHLKIFQKSDTEYYYLLPDRIDMKVIMRGGKEVPIAEMSMKIVDGDVAYWGQLRKRDNKKLFDMESMFMKLLPYIVPVLMVMLVIFFTYLITDKWDVFASAAQALREAAEALRDISVAETIIG